MLSYIALGYNIQRARLRKGLTQEQVAARMNVTFTYYGRYERGEAKPSLDRMVEICEIISVPIEDMFIGTYDTLGELEVSFRNVEESKELIVGVLQAAGYGLFVPCEA